MTVGSNTSPLNYLVLIDHQEILWRKIDGRALALKQIEERFESEWVLVENPETNDALEVQRGKVLWHSKDRDQVYRKAVELRPKRFAMLYTGKIPEDTAIVL
ncbi:MAG TPA: hypothetical protein VF173_15395 [Thermoanaerobaculia bacterium]|nr:hypothetical protein [Thermoanaerobaculia bacterium]